MVDVRALSGPSTLELVVSLIVAVVLFGGALLGALWWATKPMGK